MDNKNKTFFSILLVIAAIYLANFLFFGFEWRNLAFAAGFSLSAYGTYKNSTLLTLTGSVLVMAVFVAKYA